MKLVSSILLLVSSLLLIVYPLWGVFSPESYAVELVQHHEHAEGYSMGQVATAATTLWIANSILALSFISLFLFIRNPYSTNFGVVGGLALVLYPFFRTVTEILIGKIMLADDISLIISSEKLFFVVFGAAVIAIVKLFSELNRKRSEEDNSVEQPIR